MDIEDPSLVVIDEIAGQLLTLMAAPLTWQWYLASFVAFRIFDLAKPWPASWADREVPGGFGAMLDDMIAAAKIGLAAMYPRLDEWQQTRRSLDPDGTFTSDLALRLGI